MLDTEFLSPGPVTVCHRDREFQGELFSDGRIKDRDTSLVYTSPGEWSIAVKQRAARRTNAKIKDNGWRNVHYVENGLSLDKIKKVVLANRIMKVANVWGRSVRVRIRANDHMVGRPCKQSSMRGTRRARNPFFRLPADWQRIKKTRTTGRTKGQTDVYYVGPSGKRCRSLVEVERFLIRTGSLPMTDGTTAVESNLSEGGPSKRQRTSQSKHRAKNTTYSTFKRRRRGDVTVYEAKPAMKKVKLDQKGSEETFLIKPASSETLVEAAPITASTSVADDAAAVENPALVVPPKPKLFGGMALIGKRT